MNRKHARGFTVIELALASAVTALVGLSVAAAAMVLSSSYEQGETYQDYVQSARSTSLRLQNSIRRAKLITSCTGTALVFWAGDYNANGSINLTELVRISYDSGTKELRETQITLTGLVAETAALVDSLIPLATAMDDSAVRNLLDVTYKSYRDDRVLATSVRSAEFRVDVAPPHTQRVHIRLDVGDREQNLVVQPAVTLRAPSTSQIGISGQTYVLITGVL